MKAKIGRVPNLYRLMGHSPAALSAYLSIGAALESARLEARGGRATSGREAAAVALAVRLVEKRGWIDDTGLAGFRAQGLSDTEIVEVIAVVAQTTFSNYTNHVAHTPIDFPLAENLPAQP